MPFTCLFTSFLFSLANYENRNLSLLYCHFLEPVSSQISSPLSFLSWPSLFPHSYTLSRTQCWYSASSAPCGSCWGREHALLPAQQFHRRQRKWWSDHGPCVWHLRCIEQCLLQHRTICRTPLWGTWSYLVLTRNDKETDCQLLLQKKKWKAQWFRKVVVAPPTRSHGAASCLDLTLSTESRNGKFSALSPRISAQQTHKCKYLVL